ncbi:hypothetical protein PN498_26640 [Oscillatoria sp. CS-180]|uniref:hypothetical protein n=1 Tax=Oscillatoria sp. CS-180 TaxID=3021720 RepID=UPI00232A883E|nr:hypothetical protein [Oscillatoria sp. CS-180]MDB9529597.1 hypothetical protein [Oscillatoria sp. CS-180]
MTLTIRYAKIERHEDRQYLDRWCDETEGNHDIAPLQHNWSLCIDRIPSEATISPAEGHWQPELGHIEVEFHLLNQLAFGYRTRTDTDLVNEWLPDQQVRQVVRRIHSTFWFFREVRRYGANCAILGPEEVRDRFANNVALQYQQYFPAS